MINVIKNHTISKDDVEIISKAPSKPIKESTRYFRNSTPDNSNDDLVSEDDEQDNNKNEDEKNEESDIEEIEESTNDRFPKPVSIISNHHESSNDSDASTEKIGVKRKKSTANLQNKQAIKKKASTTPGIKKSKSRLEVSEASQGPQSIRRLKNRKSKKINDEFEEDDDIEFEMSQSIKTVLSDTQRRTANSSLSTTDKIALTCLNNQLYRNELLVIDYNYLYGAEGSHNVRTPTEDAIESTIVSLQTNPSGILLHLSKLVVILEHNPETSEVVQIPEKFSDLIKLLVHPLKSSTSLNPFMLTVICGNHRLAACKRIVDEKRDHYKMFVNCKLSMDLFYNLDNDQIKAIATLDNSVAQATNPLTLGQQVEFIYNQWNDETNILGGKLKPIIRDIILKNVIKDPKFKSNLQDKEKSVLYNSNAPFMNACRLSPQLFKYIHPLLDAKVIKKQMFIDLCNLKNEDTILTLVRQLKFDSKGAEIKDIDNQIKRIRWTSAIWQATKDVCKLNKVEYDSDSEYSRLFGSRDQLYCKFGVSFMNTFSKSTFIPTGNALFNPTSAKKKKITPFPPAFIKFINEKIQRLSKNSKKSQNQNFINKDEASFLENYNITKFTPSNESTYTVPSDHYLFDGDATSIEYWKNVVELVKFSNLDCNLIILDPPFSVLKEKWDKEFPIESFADIFNNAYISFPDANFIIFHSDKMIPAIYDILRQNDFKQYCLCTYFTTGKPLRNYFDNFAYLCQYYTIACKSDKWKLSALNDSSGKSLTPLMRTNFRIIEKFSKTVDLNNLIINPSEKSITLLRSLISLFSCPGNIVIDPMCGSGSTAEACLSLNISSISFDLRPEQVSASSKRLQAVSVSSKDYLPIDSPCDFPSLTSIYPESVEVEENDIFNLDPELINLDVEAKCQHCDAVTNLFTCICNLHSNCPIHKDLPCKVDVTDHQQENVAESDQAVASDSTNDDN
jgi:hypothetical protein